MAALARRRGHPSEEAMMCIPGLGENKTRPRKKKRQGRSRSRERIRRSRWSDGARKLRVAVE